MQPVAVYTYTLRMRLRTHTDTHTHRKCELQAQSPRLVGCHDKQSQLGIHPKRWQRIGLGRGCMEEGWGEQEGRGGTGGLGEKLAWTRWEGNKLRSLLPLLKLTLKCLSAVSLPQKEQINCNLPGCAKLTPCAGLMFGSTQSWHTGVNSETDFIILLSARLQISVNPPNLKRFL